MREELLDESSETLRQGYTIFLHDPGSIVLSKNSQINLQLTNSPDWKLIYPFADFKVFASKNIADEISEQLPQSVLAFLKSHSRKA